MRTHSALVILLSFVLLNAYTQTDASFYERLNTSKDWVLQLDDDGTSNWREHWFLDGQKATITHSSNGMDFSAGPENRNDAHHAVLWTKKSFDGDLKMTYDYTRTDSQIVNVNILYIQAQGIGTEDFDEDISLWNAYREIPTMSKYFYNMDALHISYAAFKMINEDSKLDYIRVRKYPAEQGKFRDTGIEPDYFNTGLFKPGHNYSITVIKTNDKLFFSVTDKGNQHLFSWALNKDQCVEKGRIGIRHMFTRSAQYANIKVYTK